MDEVAELIEFFDNPDIPKRKDMIKCVVDTFKYLLKVILDIKLKARKDIEKHRDSKCKTCTVFKKELLNSYRSQKKMLDKLAEGKGKSKGKYYLLSAAEKEKFAKSAEDTQKVIVESVGPNEKNSDKESSSGEDSEEEGIPDRIKTRGRSTRSNHTAEEDSQDTKGDSQDTKGDSQDTKGDSQDAKGDSQKAEEDSQEGEEESHSSSDEEGDMKRPDNIRVKHPRQGRKNIKRSRHSDEEPSQSSKRAKPGSPEFVKPEGIPKRVVFQNTEDVRNQGNDRRRSNLKHVVPDTCDVSMMDRNTRNRPNIVIPETLDMNAVNSSRDEDTSDGLDVSEVLCPASAVPAPQPLPDSIAHVDLSPPGLTSTPAAALKKSKPARAVTNPIYTELSESDRYTAVLHETVDLVDDAVDVKDDDDVTRVDTPHKAEEILTAGFPDLSTPPPRPRFTIDRPGGDSQAFGGDCDNYAASQEHIADLSTVSNPSPSVISGMSSQASSTAAPTASHAKKLTKVRKKLSPESNQGRGRKNRLSQRKGTRSGTRSQSSVKGSQDNTNVWLSAGNADSQDDFQDPTPTRRMRQTTLSQFPFRSPNKKKNRGEEIISQEEQAAIEKAKMNSLQDQSNLWNSAVPQKSPMSPEKKLPDNKPSTPTRRRGRAEYTEGLRKSPRLNRKKENTDYQSISTYGTRKSSLDESCEMTMYKVPPQRNTSIMCSERLSQYDSEPETARASPSLKPPSQKSLEAISIHSSQEAGDDSGDDSEDDLLASTPQNDKASATRSIIGSLGSQITARRTLHPGTGPAGKRAELPAIPSTSTEGSMEIRMFEEDERNATAEDGDSEQSAVFTKQASSARTRNRPATHIDSQDIGEDEADGYNDRGADGHGGGDGRNADDSYTRLFRKKDEPEFAHVAVVRKKQERKEMQAKVCAQCEKYFCGFDHLTKEEYEERLKNCRHKHLYLAPDTPDNFWDIGFPDTQEAKEKDLLHTTQVKPSKFRRKRKLETRFKNDDSD